MKTKGKAPKNIVISHVYSSDNKGDAALTSVLIADIRRVFPGANLTILKLTAVSKNSTFEGVPEKPSFMYWALNTYRHPLAKLLYTVYMVSATLGWAALGQRLYLPAHLREIANIYHKADLIVPVGGGYIRSRPGLMHRLNVPLLLHALLFGYLLGKPTVLYAQSVGPFQNMFEEWLVRFVLRRMTRIMLREDTSVALLTKLGVTQNITRAVDSGFLLSSTKTIDIRKKYTIPENTLLVGVTVRVWLKGVAQTRYEQAVAKALDTLIETNHAHIIFIPQVTATHDDDRVVSKRVYRFMRRAHAATLIADTPDYHRIKALYNGVDILLGTRFHSVIFALTALVPVLAIEYEHKTSGIMHDLQLDEWVIKIEDVTATKLTALLQKLTSHQPEYRAHLQHHLPNYTLKAQANAHILADSYYAITE